MLACIWFEQNGNITSLLKTSHSSYVFRSYVDVELCDDSTRVQIHRNNMAAVSSWTGYEDHEIGVAEGGNPTDTKQNFPKQRLLLCCVSFATQRVSQLSYGIYSCFS